MKTFLRTLLLLIGLPVAVAAQVQIPAQPGLGGSGSGGDVNITEVGGVAIGTTVPVSGSVSTTPLPPTTAGPTTFMGTGHLDIILSGNVGVGEVITFTGFSGQIRHFVSYDGGATFPSLVPFAEVDSGVIRPDTETETAETSTDVHYIMVPPGATHIRFDIPAYTGGSAVVTLYGNNLPAAGLGFPGLGINGNTTYIQSGWQLGGTPTGTPGQQFLTVGVTNAAPSGSAPAIINRNISGMAAITGTDPADGLVQYMGGKNLTTNDARFIKMRDDAPGVSDTGLLTRNIFSDAATSGALGALNATVTLPVTAAGVSAIQLVGNLDGSVRPEGSTDGGTTWGQLQYATNVANTIFWGGTTLLASVLNNGPILYVPTQGLTHVRMKVIVYNSGSSTAYIVATRDASIYGQPPYNVLNAQAERLSDGAAFYDATKTGQLPAALVGGRLDANVGAWLGSTAPTVGSKTSANSIPVVIASDQGAIAVSGPLTDTQLRATPVPISGTVTTAPPANATTNVTQFGSNNVVTGVGTSGNGIPRVTVSSDSSLALHQSVNVDQIAGTTPVMSTTLPPNGDAGLEVRPIPQVRVVGPTALGALNDTIAIDLTGFQSAGGWIDTSTLVGQLLFEVSADGGTTWFSQYVYSNSGHGQVFNLIDPVSNQTFSYLLSSSYTNARVRMLAYVSGSVTIKLLGSTVTDGVTAVTAGLNGFIIPHWSTLVAGADGSGMTRSLGMANAQPGVSDYGVTTREAARGQSTMANSIPVTLASDQPTSVSTIAVGTPGSPIPVNTIQVGGQNAAGNVAELFAPAGVLQVQSQPVGIAAFRKPCNALRRTNCR